MKKIAFIFPGQGSQEVGMGSDIQEFSPEAKKVFTTADDCLKFGLSELIAKGPKEVLTETKNTQPALLTTSVAYLRLLEKEGISPTFTAGHSLGEYSALVASGVLSFEDAVTLVRKRGELMEEAVPNGEGAMAAVLGLAQELLEQAAKEVREAGDIVQLANLNCPGQIVVSGSVQGVAVLSEKAKELGARRVLSLEVSGPFHSELMKPAAEQFQAELANKEFRNAAIPVVSNVTAQAVTEGKQVANLLIEQLYSPVHWEASVRYMIEQGVDTFVEIGPGKVLGGLVKKTERSATVCFVNSVESFQETVQFLKEGDQK
ncbi:ACP S-malonyltransferase [Aureibacillus halotolerans]|uniref:Malonyl CoA-acyl carrier protein transacylase n=1 Tax=Aureibacillus halotolerans TaxID=1508390 RepID=A0A4R6U793_9BACI|nr:ACP S-malonyltransferase [Aureibacillus halotolerans]TDQ42388.1 [acyl-carrier-protein] S-malonyltransferase [Aureibacillus halotolerans]